MSSSQTELSSSPKEETESMQSPSPSSSPSTEWNLIPSERERKIFVGGLSWMSTEDSLDAYFKSLGEPVDRVVIMREKVTGRSRGFGFVIASTVEAMERIVSRPHVVDGKKIEAKKAIPKAEMNNPAKKVFVGGVALGVDDDQFRDYFSLFGTVAESQIIRDRLTGRSRGFGFVTFVDEESVDKVLLQRHLIQGKEVEVKMAEPRKAQPLVRHVIQPVLVPAGYMGGGHYSSSDDMYMHDMGNSQRRRRLGPYHARAKSGGPVYPPTYLPSGAGVEYWPTQGYPMDSGDYRLLHAHQDVPLRPMPHRRSNTVHSEPRYMSSEAESPRRLEPDAARYAQNPPSSPSDLDLTSLHISDLSGDFGPEPEETKQAYRRGEEAQQSRNYPPRSFQNGNRPRQYEEDYVSPFNHNGAPPQPDGDFPPDLMYSPQNSEWESIKGIFPPPPPGQSYYIAPQLGGGW